MHLGKLWNYVFPQWNNLNAKGNICVKLCHIFEVWSEAHIVLTELHKSILKSHNFIFGSKVMLVGFWGILVYTQTG